MNNTMKAALLTLLTITTPLLAEIRSWKDVTGQHEVKAELVGVQGGTVTLKREDGRIVKLQLAQLSKEDQAFLGAGSAGSSGKAAATSTGGSTGWLQFRGIGNMGTTNAKLPDTWGDTENIVWKVALEGLGTSSPVVLGNKIFLTSGVGGADDLVRHVLCIDAATGKILWDTPVKADLPEQTRIREDHGYASSTPAINDTHIFVFFGKSGVFCFDHAGKQIWNTKVGDQLNGWGSAASVTLHGKSVLVNASVESESLVALDQATGKELWKAEGIKECWHAPALVRSATGSTEVITALAGEVRSFDADSGKPLWQCKTGIAWYMCPTPVSRDGIVYAVGGRSGVGGLAIRTGGSGDVTDSHKLWTLQKGTNVPSPILHGRHLYFANDNQGLAHCVDVKTGEFVYSERLDSRPGRIYASPLLANGKIYYFGGGGTTVIVSAEPSFKVLSTARLEDDRGVFNSSPAVIGDRLLLRSNKFLYCIGR
jgi:outer membrane protein assembly factor BamB